MNHPPYHLRPNKAVDRFLLIDLLKKLHGCLELSQYTYYGFGGPFLEDFRLFYQFFPEIDLVSLESDYATFKRQQFHKFSKVLKLENKSFHDFLGDFESDGKEIFWLDYTNFDIGRFDELNRLLANSESGVLVKVTLRLGRDVNTYEIYGSQHGGIKEFIKKYHEFLPNPLPKYHLEPRKFPKLVQDMIQIAAEKALPANCGFIFQPLNSVYYSDGTQMLSVTGIVLRNSEKNKVNNCLKNWKFSNLSWKKDPIRIDVPFLSLKERLHLEEFLPDNGNALAKRMKYSVGDNNIKQLSQYADFYSYYPYFVKVNL
jgi:hypothetical protein